MSATLQILMQQAEREIPFDAASYPLMKDMTREEGLAFAVHHLNLHMMQVVGKLAAISGNVEHAAPLDIQKVTALMPEMLIYVARLASVAGMSASALADGVENQYVEWRRMFGGE